MSLRSLSAWPKTQNKIFMGSIVLYILEWAFALTVLLIIYKAAFSRTTFYRFNRFFLLGATVLSALLPLVHITVPESTPLVSEISIHETEFAQELSGTFALTDEPAQTQFILTESDAPVLPVRKSSLWAVILVCIYSGYVIMLMVGWARSVIRAARFLHGKPRRRLSHTVWLVTHDDAFGPFSWMNFIVISDAESGFARRASLRHEYSHVKLLHSVDLVFLLACTIVNPVCWLVLQEIKIVHEYEADHEVITHYGIRNSDYQKLLILRTVGAEAYALASSFNLNIKKRIIMLNKNQTGKSRLMWLLILIPMLGITSVLFARTEKAINLDDDLRFSSGKVEMSWRQPEPYSGQLVSLKIVDEDNNPLSASFVSLYYHAPKETKKPEAASNSTTPTPPPPAAVSMTYTANHYGVTLLPIEWAGDIVTVSCHGYKTTEVTLDPDAKETVAILKKSDHPDTEEGMYIAPRNLMRIMVNRSNEILVKNGVVDRIITIDELKDLAIQFIMNPDNDSRLPELVEYEIDAPAYGVLGTVKTTIKHVFLLDYDRGASSGTLNDIRYELSKAYNVVRNEVCVREFGKEYDQCSDRQQVYARYCYSAKISDSYPQRYTIDSNGHVVKEVYERGRSAAANPELAKTNKVNKDLRIRVSYDPIRFYASTVLFEQEDGQEHQLSETSPQQISLDELNGYIDQAISDGTKFRKVRFAVHPDVPMGPVVDMKETVRNRMLLNYVEEGYKE